jgi:branched-chain amino acid transport system permease protein
MLEKIAIAVVLAVSLSIVVGFLGELSLGHAGFMCVGAYIGGKVASLMDAGAESHLTLILTVFIGGIAAAACGFAVGFALFFVIYRTTSKKNRRPRWEEQ